MSSLPEIGKHPPSAEVMNEMALTKIRFFQAANTDYRELAAIVYKHPSIKRIVRLNEISKTLAGSAEPLVETDFFRDINDTLVQKAVEALVEEIDKNRELSMAFDGDTYESVFDDEFKLGLVERVLSAELNEEGEEGLMPLIVLDPLEELSDESLITFMGDMYGSSVRDVFESLEESDDVQQRLEQEYLRKERVRTAVVGLVAFTGALGGTVLAQRLNKNK